MNIGRYTGPRIGTGKNADRGRYWPHHVFQPSQQSTYLLLLLVRVWFLKSQPALNAPPIPKLTNVKDLTLQVQLISTHVQN